MTASETVLARAIVDRGGSIVDGAEAVTARVLEALASADVVNLDLSGLGGAPSSFFNILLLAVAERFGCDAIDRRLKFRFGSGAQRRICERSMTAVRDRFSRS